MNCYCGIDLGSAAIKIVIMDESGTLIDHYICPSGGAYMKNAETALNDLLERNGLVSEDLVRTYATGYGRGLFTQADKRISEITANATGAKLVAPHLESSLRTIINIGGQDSKVIRLTDDGIVEKFIMNDKCAAGTGRFIEMSSRNLEIDLNEFESACKCCHPVRSVEVNNTCAVFAESEIIGLLANGYEKAAIMSGVFQAIARRVTRLACKVGIEEPVFFDGGAALNKGLVDALEEEMMKAVFVPDIPQITTAIGAAAAAKTGE